MVDTLKAKCNSLIITPAIIIHNKKAALFRAYL